MKSLGLSRLVLAFLVLGVAAHPVSAQSTVTEADVQISQVSVPQFGDRRTITVSVNGRGSAPAARVQVQLLFGLEMMYGPNGEMLNTQIDTNRFQQVLTQKLSAIGIPATSIELISNPLGSIYGGGGVQAIFELPQPSKELMRQALDAANQTAEAVENVMFQSMNMRLGVSCSALENLARTDAMSRAKQRSEGIAASMGVQLGEIISVIDSYADTQPYGSSCLSSTSMEFPAIAADGYYNAWTGYDPTLPLEVQVNNNITVTYAIR